MNQTQGQENSQIAKEKLEQVYKHALRFSMKRNLEAEE